MLHLIVLGILHSLCKLYVLPTSRWCRGEMSELFAKSLFLNFTLYIDCHVKRQLKPHSFAFEELSLAADGLLAHLWESENIHSIISNDSKHVHSSTRACFAHFQVLNVSCLVVCFIAFLASLQWWSLETRFLKSRSLRISVSSSSSLDFA